jgi:hypothetical protein
MQTNSDSTPKMEPYAPIAKQVQLRVQFIPIKPHADSRQLRRMNSRYQESHPSFACHK